MVIEGDLPLAFAENLEWLLFCQAFFPHASIPSRKVLTTRILRDELAFRHTKAEIHSKGQLVTLKVDGWKALKYHHSLKFMITSQTKLCIYIIYIYIYFQYSEFLKVHSIWVVNMLNQHETAQLLLEHTETIEVLLEQEWTVNIVAFTIDASNESKNAKSLFQTNII